MNEVSRIISETESGDPSAAARLLPLVYDDPGMTIEEAAEVLHISPVTAHRYWTYARAWLHQQIEPPRQPAGEES